jgi:hypothetical protein
MRRLHGHRRIIIGRSGTITNTVLVVKIRECIGRAWSEGNMLPLRAA